MNYQNFDPEAAKIIANQQAPAKWAANKAALSSLPAIIWNTDPATMDYGQYWWGKPKLNDYLYAPSNPTVRTVFLSNIEDVEESSVINNMPNLKDLNHTVDLIKAGTPITPPIYEVYKDVVDGSLVPVTTGCSDTNRFLLGGRGTVWLARLLGMDSIKIMEFQDIGSYIFSNDKWDFVYHPAVTGEGGSIAWIQFVKKTYNSVFYSFWGDNVEINDNWRVGDTPAVRVKAQRMDFAFVKPR